MCIVLYISSKHFHLCKFNIHSVLLLYTHSSITLRESLLRARPPVKCLEGCNGELQLWELKNLSGCGDEETEQTDDENLQWKRVMESKAEKTHSMREIEGLHKGSDGGPGLPL